MVEGRHPGSNVMCLSTDSGSLVCYKVVFGLKFIFILEMRLWGCFFVKILLSFEDLVFTNF